MTNLESALESLRGEMPHLRSLGIVEVDVFGSVARGEEQPDSDLDILIDLAPDHRLSLLRLVELEAELSGKIGRKVELVIGRNLKPGLRANIERDLVHVSS